MRKLIVCAGMLIASGAQAELITERTFEHRIADVGAVELDIDNVAGSVIVHGTKEKQIVIRGKLDKGVEGVEVEQSGGRVSIRVVHHDDDDDERYRHADADLQVWAPAASELLVVAVSADVKVDAIQGEQRLKSVSGDVSTEAFDANVAVGSVSGDVEVRGNGGSMEEVDIESVSGDVLGSQLSGHIRAESVSGDVEITDSQMNGGDFSSTSGDIVISGSLARGSRLEMEAISGDVELSIRGSNDGNYDLSSFSGEIDNCFGPKADNERRNPRLRFVQGKDSDDLPRVRASTMSGDIEICN